MGGQQRSRGRVAAAPARREGGLPAARAVDGFTGGQVRRRFAAASVVGALALALAGASAVGAPKPRTVKVGDDYYLPAKLTVKKGTKIQWVWHRDKDES